MLAVVPPLTGAAVLPAAPVYHRYVTPAVFADDVRVVELPDGMVTLAGCCVNAGMQTFTVPVWVEETQVPFCTRHQYDVVTEGATSMADGPAM
jgi:hypothetical protein